MQCENPVCSPWRIVYDQHCPAVSYVQGSRWIHTVWFGTNLQDPGAASLVALDPSLMFISAVDKKFVLSAGDIYTQQHTADTAL